MSKHNELTGSSGTKIDWELKIGHGWQIVTIPLPQSFHWTHPFKNYSISLFSITFQHLLTLWLFILFRQILDIKFITHFQFLIHFFNSVLTPSSDNPFFPHSIYPNPTFISVVQHSPIFFWPFPAIFRSFSDIFLTFFRWPLLTAFQNDLLVVVIATVNHFGQLALPV